ncbi:MAG: hypothetical protein RLZZ271_901 [Pseudomonadota bacterium]|jgi:multidrug resistance efflux pump
MSAVEQFTQQIQTLARLDETQDCWDEWLSLLVTGLQSEVQEAALVWGEDAVFRPVAFWPQGKPCGATLAGLCEQALALRLPSSRMGAPSYLAIPVVIGQELCGVVALQFKAAIPRNANEWIRWGMGWLANRQGRKDTEAREALRERLLSTLNLLMLVMAEKKSAHACQVAVTEMAVALGCERVSVGFGQSHRGVHLVAMSHTADVQTRLDLSKRIEAAMDEAADQGCAVVVPQPDDTESRHLILLEHLQLSTQYGSDFVLSVPFAIDSDHSCVFTFEWDAGKFSEDAEHAANTWPAVVATVLHDKRTQERSLWQRLRDRVRHEARLVLGPRHVKRKLIACGLALFVLFAVFAKGDFRVTANASLEGAVRRQVVAPFDGYVASANMRAGQMVKSGDLMALLDDRDLKLEASKWSSQQNQYASQMSDAVAQRNLAQMQIAYAQTRQAAAQRELSETMLSRSRVEAPLDGVIVSGDLSQYLGGAVKKGQALFEIAPLDSYRIVLLVEEGDIAWIRPGHKGVAMLAALAGEEIPFTVTLVTSVAQVSEGKNRFRIEAKPDAQIPSLRPGMEGVGKVSIEDARLVWIWTRKMSDWLRLQVWAYLGV